MKTYNDVNWNTVDVTIHKPLYDTFVNIRETYVRRAIKEGKLLRITIPQGTAVVDPKEWIMTGKVHKQVFLRPDEPMILYGNNVPVQLKSSQNEQLSLLWNTQLLSWQSY